MSLYDEMCEAKASVDKMRGEDENAGSFTSWDMQSLALASIAEDLHRLADSFAPLRTMGDFNRNMEELRGFFMAEESSGE